MPKDFFKSKIKKYEQQKAERKQRERLKKFPSIAIANRPMPGRREGPMSEEEKTVIRLLVQDQPQEISAEQVEILSTLMRRSPHAIRHLIVRAREQFMDNAKQYVDMHLESVRAAYVAGEFETSAKHAEWALENLSHEGTGIIEKDSKKSDNGTKIVVGVNMGGMSHPTKVLDQ